MVIASEIASGDEVAGYRVLKVLASTVGRTTCLARDEGAVPPVERVLKLFPPGQIPESVRREASVLAAVVHEHVLRLVDVANVPGGACVLVVEYLQRGSLDRLLADREMLHAGEAVTILVSVMRGIDAMHRQGIVHGAILARNIHLDQNGRPVLTGLASAGRLGDPGVDDRAFAADHEDFTRLAEHVLGRAETEGREHERARLLDWLGNTSSQEIGEDYARQIERQLMAIAQPAPVRRVKAYAEGLPSRAVPPSPKVRRNRPAEGGTARASRPSTHRSGAYGSNAYGSDARGSGVHGSGAPGGAVRAFARHLPEFAVLENALDGTLLREFKSRSRAMLHSRRKPLIFGGSIAAALLVVLLTALPGGSAEVIGSPSPPASATPSSAASSTAGDSAGAAVGRQGEGVAPSAVPNVDGAAGLAEGDDPVRAASALLASRRRCLVASSSACLERSHQADSPLWHADRTSFGEAADGGSSDGVGIESREDGSRARCADGYAGVCLASLVERTGGSALIALTPVEDDAVENGGGSRGYAKPASILVVRTDAGWRLREIFED